MKYFISSDIHSYYDLWMEQLNIKGYNKDNPDHFLIVCGDLFDRGPDPIKCLQFVNSIPNDKKALIRGNHEDLLINVLHKRRLDYYDYRNGTEATVNSLINYMAEKTNYKVDNFKDACKRLLSFNELTKYYNSLVNYYETDNFICVHGWYPHWSPDWRNDLKGWEEARWDDGFSNAFNKNNKTGKDIIFGHKFCGFGRTIEDISKKEQVDKYTEPYYGIDFIAIDARTAYTNRVNVITIIE